MKTTNMLLYVALILLSQKEDTFAQESNTLTIVEDFQVNENSVGNCAQSAPAMAAAVNGNYVIVWEDRDYSASDVYGQLFDAEGNPLSQPFRINDDRSSGWQKKPDVAFDGEGNFIVVWSDSRFNDTDIYAQYFTADGSHIGNNFKINDEDGSYSIPAIAMVTDGRAIIVWQGDNTVLGQQFDADANPVGSNFTIENNAIQPDVAVASDGSFVVTWSEAGDIYVRLFDAVGQPLAAKYRVNDDNDPVADHYEPTITMFPDKTFVIAWNDYGTVFGNVFGQRYDVQGSMLDGNFQINDETNTAMEYLAMASSAEQFIVTWLKIRTPAQETGMPVHEVMAQRYYKNGDEIGINLKVNDETSIIKTGLSHPATVMDCGNKFNIAWQAIHENDEDIILQKFGSDGLANGSNQVVTFDENCSYQLCPEIAAGRDQHFVVVWQDYETQQDNVKGQIFDSHGTAIGSNFIVNKEGSDAENPDVAILPNGDFIVVWVDKLSEGVDIFVQKYTGNGEPIGSNMCVNDAGSYYHKNDPRVIVSQDGAVVVAWQDNRNNNADIYAQFYDSNLLALGDNFIVNEINKYAPQMMPEVVFLQNSSFIVVWMDPKGYYGQLYSETAAPIGGNFRITTESPMGTPGLVSTPSDGFIMTWGSGKQRHILAQRFDNSGQVIGENIIVDDDEEEHGRYNTQVACLGNGFFAVVWTDYRVENDIDIYVQVFDTDGQPIGRNRKISNDTERYAQKDAAITSDKFNFYYAWQDSRFPTRNWDVFAKVEAGPDMPVPVELVLFTAKSIDTGIALNWVTATESNNYGFEIQRRCLPQDFEKIAFVPGKGTTSQSQTYSFVDESIDKPESYTYRLGQIDLDGSVNYSNSVTIDISPPVDFALLNAYPNPFNAGTQFSYTLPKSEKVRISIYNLKGELVKTLVDAVQSAGSYGVAWDGRSENGSIVATGVYVVQLQAGQFTANRKVLCLK